MNNRNSDNEQTEEVRLNIRMPASLRTKLRMLSASEDKPMAQWMRDQIEEEWDEMNGAVPA